MSKPPETEYGPGKTVVQPVYVEPVSPASHGAVPPSTVRDPATYAANGPAPYPAPPPQLPYGAPPPGYGAPPQLPYGAYNPSPQLPYGVPVVRPPPPAGVRKGGGPSMLVIGGVSAVVIGTVATLIAIRTQPTSDDKPIPTIDVPAAVAEDPADAGTGEAAEAPSIAPSAVKPIKPKPVVKPASLGGQPRPGGPQLAPHPPPPRHGP